MFYQPERQSHTTLDLEEPRDHAKPPQPPEDHLANISFNLGDLPEEEKPKFDELLRRYSCCFSTNFFNIGKVKGATHHIKLVPNYKIVSTRPYSIHPSMTEELHEKLKQQMDAGIIEPWHSLFHSYFASLRIKSYRQRMVSEKFLMNCR